MFSDPMLPLLGQTQDSFYLTFRQHIQWTTSTENPKLSAEPTEIKYDMIDPSRIWWAKVKIIKLHSAYVAGVPSMQHLHCAFYSDLKALLHYGTNTSSLKD